MRRRLVRHYLRALLANSESSLRLGEAHAAAVNKTNKANDSKPLSSSASEEVPTKVPEPFNPRLYSATQVKEKYGLLRVYMEWYTDEIDDAIEAAETKTETTCEYCGSEGTLHQDYWWRILCEPCEEGYQARRAARWGRLAPRRDSGVGLEATGEA